MRGKWYETNVQRMQETERRSAWSQRRNVVPLRGGLGSRRGPSGWLPSLGSAAALHAEPIRVSRLYSSHLLIFWMFTERPTQRGQESSLRNPVMWPRVKPWLGRHLWATSPGPRATCQGVGPPRRKENRSISREACSFMLPRFSFLGLINSQWKC